MKMLKNLTKTQKKNLFRIVIGAGLLAALHVTALSFPWKLVLYCVPYLVVGYDVLWKAVRNLTGGQLLDENFLMAIATVGAFGIGDYSEGVFVMLFYQIGELFQSIAVSQSRRSVSALMEIRPDYAHVERDGEVITIAPDEVAVGEVIVVRPGERVPLDGTVTEGRASVDTAALTGESVPRDVEIGDQVLSGCICMGSVIRLTVTQPFGESTVSKILELVENASEGKAKAEDFITKFAHWYTPVVVAAAFLTALLPPLLGMGEWTEWLHKALTFLVISCPCALVISVPLGFFGGIGGASRCGILMKGGNYMERLAKAETVVMDKTGTLTKGSFRVTEIHSAGARTERELLSLMAHGEYYFTHPIALSIKKAYAQPLDPDRITDAGEMTGHGVFARIDGHAVLVGNQKMMEQEKIVLPAIDVSGTVVYTAVDGEYAGYAVISDEIKPEAAEAIDDMKRVGVRQCVMLTGDAESTAKNVAEKLGLDAYHAQLLPEDKVRRLEELLRHKTKDRTVVFVGDGINDAPVLVRADVGIAMGGLGADAAVEAADVVIMNDEISKIPLAIQICKRTLTIVRENIWFALSVKLLILILSFFGKANMWEAVFADVGVSVIAILNAMRTLSCGNALRAAPSRRRNESCSPEE